MDKKNIIFLCNIASLYCYLYSIIKINTKKRSFYYQQLLFNSDFDLPISVQGVEPALHKQCPLEAEGSDEEVETHSTKAVPLEERHQKAKPNEDHHMDILETWEEENEKWKWSVKMFSPSQCGCPLMLYKQTIKVKVPGLSHCPYLRNAWIMRNHPDPSRPGHKDSRPA